MMKKYIDPKMNVTVFDAKSVVTVSGGEQQSYESWKSSRTGTVGEITLAYDSFSEVAYMDK